MGIQANLSRGGTVAGAQAWRNTTGISLLQAPSAPMTLRDSRVYGNTTGIFVFARDTLISGNTVYDNATGIHVSGSSGGTSGPIPGVRLLNNLIYDSSLRGVLIQDANPTPFSGTLLPLMSNNTVVERVADAVQVLSLIHI